MIFIKRIFTLSILIAFFFGCKSSGNEKNSITSKEFVELYKPATNINIADTGLSNFGDTTTIDYATFIQFIPDSALQKVLATKSDQYIIHPAGIIHTKTIDYLLTTFTSGKLIKLIVFVLDDKHQYISSLQLINNLHADKYNYSLSVTNEPTFIVRKDKTATNNKTLYSRSGYAYSETLKDFAVVMNDSNEDTAETNSIINPIDTLPAINKWSGNYITNEKNFIAVRDGKSENNYLFFIHFENKKGDCIGELKGQLSLTDANNAVYQESGDPCVIRFKFSTKNIVVKEEGNCGNYRGITCPFDFTFKKKVPVKLKPSNK